MNDLKETLDEGLNPFDVEIGFEGPIQEIQIHDMFRRVNQTRVQKRFVKSAIETVSGEVFC